jgi:hypothetical protein
MGYLDKDSQTIIIVAIVAVLIIIIVWSLIAVVVFKRKDVKPIFGYRDSFKNADGNEVQYSPFLDYNIYHSEQKLDDIFKEPFNPNEVQSNNNTTQSRKKQLAPRISGKESAMAYTLKSDINSEREDIEIANDKNINMINHKKYIQDMFDHQLKSGNLYN